MFWMLYFNTTEPAVDRYIYFVLLVIYENVECHSSNFFENIIPTKINKQTFY